MKSHDVLQILRSLIDLFDCDRTIRVCCDIWLPADRLHRRQLFVIRTVGFRECDGLSSVFKGAVRHYDTFC